MTVSVIIPCYNAGRYLAECLDSLLAQTMTDFEAILIDDGSTDDTAQIARGYAAKDARIRLLSQANAGVSAARNAGLNAARGEWLAFVDADDLLPADAFARMLACAGEDVDCVVSTHEVFSDGGMRETVFPETLWMDRAGESRRHAAALRLIEGDSVLNIMCNKLHRREAVARGGLRLAHGVRIAEDALFNLEAVLCARGIAFCEDVTYSYRIHPQSATQTREKNEFDVHLPWFCGMKALLARRGVLERYYPAFVSSVVLRLYKDGGVAGVMREFTKKAAPLLEGGVRAHALSLRGRALYALCRSGWYPRVYPLIFPFELVSRKVREAAFALRIRRRSRRG